jgi:hypothetical protein
MTRQDAQILFDGSSGDMAAPLKRLASNVLTNGNDDQRRSYDLEASASSS